MYVPVSDAELSAFMARAYERAPAVRRLMEAAGLRPEALGAAREWLPRLAVTTKEALSRQQQEQPPFGGWVAAGPGELARVFVSPGPIYNVEAAVEDDWAAAEAMAGAGFRRGDLVLNTFSYHLSPASFMVEAGLRALGAAVVPAGTASKSEQARLLLHLPVTGFAGVPSYLKALLDEVAAQAGASERAAHRGPSGLRLRRAWCAAERLDEQLRRELRDEWGIEAYQGYGTAEVGLVAYECPERSGLHLSRRHVVELLDPVTREPVPDGETGEVVVSALRPAYPLVRLATGDLSRLITEPCPCGRGSPRLAGVLGRVGTGVKVRGMFVYPHQIEQLSTAVPGLRRVAARVERGADFRDVLTLLAEPDPQRGEPTDPGWLDRLAAQARERLRVRPDRVELVAPGTLAGRPALEDRREAGPAEA